MLPPSTRKALQCIDDAFQSHCTACFEENRIAFAEHGTEVIRNRGDVVVCGGGELQDVRFGHTADDCTCGNVGCFLADRDKGIDAKLAEEPTDTLMKPRGVSAELLHVAEDSDGSAAGCFL